METKEHPILKNSTKAIKHLTDVVLNYPVEQQNQIINQVTSNVAIEKATTYHFAKAAWDKALGDMEDYLKLNPAKEYVVKERLEELHAAAERLKVETK